MGLVTGLTGIKTAIQKNAKIDLNVVEGLINDIHGEIDKFQNETYPIIDGKIPKLDSPQRRQPEPNLIRSSIQKRGVERRNSDPGRNTSNYASNNYSRTSGQSGRDLLNQMPRNTNNLGLRGPQKGLYGGGKKSKGRYM